MVKMIMSLFCVFCKNTSKEKSQFGTDSYINLILWDNYLPHTSRP